MTLDDLKKHFKSTYIFSKRTGMSSSSWVNWKRQGYIPMNSQIKLERMTEGKLKASIDDIRNFIE